MFFPNQYTDLHPILAGHLDKVIGQHGATNVQTTILVGTGLVVSADALGLHNGFGMRRSFLNQQLANLNPFRS